MMLAELSGEQLFHISKAGLGIIVPFGSVEYHGPHLPLGTDGILAEAFARNIGTQLALPVAPALYYGPCFNLRDHPGTLSIRTTIFQEFLLNLLLEMVRVGFSQMFLFSGHAEGSQLISIREAAEIVMQTNPVVRIHLFSTYDISKQLAPPDSREDLHAGMLETSLMLHVAPHLVDMKSAPGESEKSLPAHALVRSKRDFWPSGVSGTPCEASKELGQHVFAATVDYLLNYVRRSLQCPLTSKAADP